MKMPPLLNCRRGLSLSVMVALSFGLIAVLPVASAPVAQAASYTKPSGLKAAKTSAHSIALTWTAVKKAPAYRVSFSAKSNMSSAKTIDVVGNYLEWSRVNPDSVTASARLTSNKYYYFRVKVISLTKATLSGYSKVLKAKTASATSYPELAPRATKVTARSTTSVYLSWASRGPGVRYKIIYGTTSSLPRAKSKIVTSDYSATELTGLTSGKKYYYKVKVISTAGIELSLYSSAASFTATTSAVSPSIKVATYNLCSYACSSTWTTRLPAIVANLVEQAPDIVALQEISTSPLKGFLSAWNEASGRSYTTSDSPTKSVSNSTRLAYDSDRFTVVDHGVLTLSYVNNDPKYAVWAILKDTTSDKSLFAVATHLTVGVSYYEMRETQAQEIVDLVSSKNTEDLPVVIAGDFNSGKAYKPSNTIYNVLTAAGYKDPLGNTNNSWAISSAATAEHRVDLEYNTFNGFKTRANVSKYANGYDVDYIWHNSKVRVAMSQVVVNLDTSGQFVGTIPSDHNMLTATIHLKS